MQKRIKKILVHFFASTLNDVGSKVVYYHDIGDKYTKMGTSLELFKRHVDIARTYGFSYVPKLDFGCKSMENTNQLMLCFDDGFRGILEACDYFCRENLHPTVFLPTDLVGKPGYLRWDEILDLQKLGFTFQSHTCSHQTLSGVGIEALEGQMIHRSNEWLRHELYDSRNNISDRLCSEVRALCFPAGKFSRKILQLCQVIGYTELYTSIPGVLSRLDFLKPSENCHVVPRHLCQDLHPTEFLDVIKGGMRPFTRHYLSRHCDRDME